VTDDIDLRGLAVELHRSYSWASRNWRELCEQEGLPWPFVGRGAGGRPWWTRAAVRAWKGGQGSGRIAQPTDDPRAYLEGVLAAIANDPLPIRDADESRVAQLLAAAGG